MSRRTVYRGRVVHLYLDEVPGPDGRLHLREIVEHAGGVAVVAVDAEQRVLLVRQHRPAVGQMLLELPAGILGPDEAPEACARRELAEETGARVERLEPLTSFYSTPGFCTEELHLFLATGLRDGPQQLEDGEHLTVERVPVADLPGLIARGEIRDAKTLVGLLLYLRRAER